MLPKTSIMGLIFNLCLWLEVTVGHYVLAVAVSNWNDLKLPTDCCSMKHFLYLWLSVPNSLFVSTSYILFLIFFLSSRWEVWWLAVSQFPVDSVNLFTPFFSSFLINTVFVYNFSLLWTKKPQMTIPCMQFLSQNFSNVTIICSTVTSKHFFSLTSVLL